uniref:Protein kinase domain-containing protein n=1 Tax=Parascaris univalens TaxID=6257 RepID=A0A915A0H9_PARUN
MSEGQHADPTAPDNAKATPLKVGTILNGRFKIVELTLNHPVLGKRGICLKKLVKIFRKWRLWHFLQSPLSRA